MTESSQSPSNSRVSSRSLYTSNFCLFDARPENLISLPELRLQDSAEIFHNIRIGSYGRGGPSAVVPLSKPVKV